MVACSNSSANADTVESIVCSLIQKDCILNMGDKFGQTPLMRAISSGQVIVVQRLLDQAVNIEMRDQKGWTVSILILIYCLNLNSNCPDINKTNGLTTNEMLRLDDPRSWPLHTITAATSWPLVMIVVH